MVFSDKTLLLFTGSFPYYKISEETFLNAEIKHLAASFQRVVLVPSKIYGKRHRLPEGVEVDESFGLDRENEVNPFRIINSVVSALLSPLFYRDILAKPSILCTPREVKKLMKFVGWAAYTRKWVRQFIEREEIDLAETVFYSCWLYSTTLGIGLAKEKYFPEIKLVSRSHGFDLYEEDFRHYIPCREKTLKNLDRLFLISGHGKRYIIQRYAWLEHKCRLSRLGVSAAGFVTPQSSDGAFRIVSCSIMTALKQLPLLIEGIRVAAKSRPEAMFQWHHLGDGPERSQVEEIARKTLPENASCFFHGLLSHEKVLAYYRDNPVDVFMNVSRTEGLPVSIMEAQSFGIPVIAPEICGIPEIVSHKNGILLSRNPSPEEVAEAILKIGDNPSLALEKRNLSLENWQSEYDADSNFPHFTEQLLSLF